MKDKTTFMKRLLQMKMFLFFLISTLFFQASYAQDLENPGKYMSYIGDKQTAVTKTFMNYLSAVSHGKSARKVEKLREKVLNTILIQECR